MVLCSIYLVTLCLLTGVYGPFTFKVIVDRYVVVVVQLLSYVQLCDPMDCSMPGSSGPLLSPRVCSNSCPLSWWCYLTISSSVVPFSSCLQSFPASGSFPMSWFFSSGGYSIDTSALATVLPMSIQGWFPRTDWFDLLSVQGTLKNLL